MNKSILWGTAEAKCWARGYNYEEYCEWHELDFPGVGAESPELYADLCRALDADMLKDAP